MADPTCIGWHVLLVSGGDLMLYGKNGESGPPTTEEDAVATAEHLQKTDPKGHIYLARVWSNGNLKTMEWVPCPKP